MGKKVATIKQVKNNTENRYEYFVNEYDVSESVNYLLLKYKEEYDKEKFNIGSVKGYCEAQKYYEKQITELKAENEKLKEDKNYLIRVISKYTEPLPNGVTFDIATDDMRYQIVSNLCDRNHKHIEEKRNLRQQLEEKENEVEELKKKTKSISLQK